MSPRMKLSTMKIGVLQSGWFDRAAGVLSIDTVPLPVPAHPLGPYKADPASRTANGTEIERLLREKPVDLMVDNGGAGLAFITGQNQDANVSLAHEKLGTTLYSHFIDPMVTAFQGMGWNVVWPCLQSKSWVKAVWDRAQAFELQQFGVPSVVHLPMAAPDRTYNTEPLDARNCEQTVSFVGGQNTSYFTSKMSVPSDSLFAGTLAHAVRANMGQASFYDIYHELYSLAEPVQPNDDLETQTRKTLAYFNAKLFFNAALCIRNRDRFVIFLKQKLADMFRLVGRGWDTAYGLATQAPFPSDGGYFDHFRRTAINLNLVNGNAETGLNMRHFEITAAGGFMLCHYQPEIEELFRVGKECDVFHSEADLLEKIKHYLAHPKERIAMALAGQQRTLSEHLYSHRLNTILQLSGNKECPQTSQPCSIGDVQESAWVSSHPQVGASNES